MERVNLIENFIPKYNNAVEKSADWILFIGNIYNIEAKEDKTLFQVLSYIVPQCTFH